MGSFVHLPFQKESFQYIGCLTRRATALPLRHLRCVHPPRHILYTRFTYPLFPSTATRLHTLPLHQFPFGHYHSTFFSTIASPATLYLESNRRSSLKNTKKFQKKKAISPPLPRLCFTNRSAIKRTPLSGNSHHVCSTAFLQTTSR